MAAASSGQAEQSKPAGETPVRRRPPRRSLQRRTCWRDTRAIGGESILRSTAHAGRRAGSNCARRASADRSRSSPHAPDRILIRITLGGLGELQRGYDGEVGWSTDPAVGPRVLTGRELDETRCAADFYADLYAASDYSSMSVVRRETFEGHDCFTVKLVRVSGSNRWSISTSRPACASAAA